jgi:hypothetical protein
MRAYSNCCVQNKFEFQSRQALPSKAALLEHFQHIEVAVHSWFDAA